MNASPVISLFAALAGCFTLATWLEPRLRTPEGAAEGDLLTVVMGDGRRLFANQFFVQADVYFHSGYYPSMFDDQGMHEENHMAGGGDEHEHDHDFLGKPKDWIDAFGRHFYVTEHTHLERDGLEREMLPWLYFSARMDPHRIDTYTVAGFWLRTKLGKVKEAEEFLREGLRANPGSVPILYELGALLEEGRKDSHRARNVWEQALIRWRETEGKLEEPDIFLFQQIVGRLARLEREQRRYAQSIAYFKMLKSVSPKPAAVQKQIGELEALLKHP